MLVRSSTRGSPAMPGSRTPAARQASGFAPIFMARSARYDYLESGLRLVAGLLGLDPVFCRNSTLGLSPTLKSQERVIAAVKAVGGDHT